MTQTAQTNPKLDAAWTIYILYLVALVVPFVAIGGVVYAYIERGKDPVLDTHLTFQIRTFWWGLLFLVGGALLSLILIGFAILLFWTVWLVVRCVTGMQLAEKSIPISGTEILGMKAV